MPPRRSAEDVRLVALLDALPIPASVASASERLVLYANEAWVRLLGFSEVGEVVGRTVESLIAPGSLEKARSALAHGHATGEYSRTDRRYQLLRADGTLLDVEIAGANVTLGGAPAIVSLLSDVSDEEQTHRSLEASELGYRTLIEHATDAMIVYRDETILFANPAGVALYGAKRTDEVVGRPIWDFIAPQSRKMSLKRVKAIESDRPTLPPARVHLVALDGQQFAAEAHDVQIPWDGGTAVLTTLRDLRPGEAALEAVAEAEAFAQTIVDSIPIGMHFYRLEDDDRLIFTGANAAAEAILGFDQSTLVGKEIRDAFPSHADSGIPQIYAAVAREGRAWHQESVVYEDDRIASCFDVHAFQTGPGSMVAAFTDITERKQAEVDLAEVSERQSAIFKTMNDGFSVLDANGVHMSVNPALCEMTGFAEEELVGVGPPHPYWPPEEYDTIGASFESTILGEASESELTFMRKNGERFPVIVTPSIVRDAHGDMVTAYATVRDITARKRAEEELRESEQRLRLSLAATRQGLYDLDLRTGVASVTSEYLTMIGDDPAAREFDLASFGERIHPEDAPHVLEVVDAYTRGDIDEYREEYRLRHASGEWIWVLSIGRVVERDTAGRAVRVLGTHMDITERRLAEAQLMTYKEGLERVVEERTRELTEANQALEEASHAKSQFLASMSHELRTPLNSIIGFTGIMLQGLTGELTSEQRAQLEMVNRAGRQLLGLVSDVLDLERIEAGRVEVELEDVDIAKLATALSDSVRPMAEDMGLAVTLDLAAAPRSVRTDRSKLEQILLNFLSNAVKYTEVGEIALVVASRADGSIAFTVRDTGIGIAGEDQASIFEEFRQLPAHRGAKHPGSGLGLAISVQLAELIGGRIELVSAAGQGSTFTIVLPAAPSA
jgi:PAS domain S-box-containing protein